MHYGYLLRGSISGLWKVGISGNIKRRYASYKTHVPEPVILEMQWEFPTQEEAVIWERAILGMHRLECVHGEWLSLELGDVAFLAHSGIEKIGWIGDDDNWLVKDSDTPYARMLSFDSDQTRCKLDGYLNGNIFRRAVLTRIPRMVTARFNCWDVGIG